MLNDDAPWAPQKIAERLAQQQALRGYSWKDCLEKAGVDEGTLRRIREGFWPTIPTLIRLAHGFDTTLPWLLLGDAAAPAEPRCDPIVVRAAIGVVVQIVKATPSLTAQDPFITQTDAMAALTFSAYAMWVSALKIDPNALSNATVSLVIEDKLKAELSSTVDLPPPGGA